METEVTTTEIAILFSDIVGSTTLYEEIGDIEAHHLVVQCLDTMRSAVESVGGTLLRTVGDAVLAKFNVCDDAYLAAREMQKSQESSQLSIRIGFHWGEAIPTQGDVYGNAVNIAARVAGLANGNEIVVTREVVDRLSREYRADTLFLRKINVKGLHTPTALFRLRWKPETQNSVSRIFTHREKRTHELASMKIELSNDHKTVTLQAHGDKCTIGRESENTLQTTHGTASRLHATITCKQGKFYLEDASTNGTYVIKTTQQPVFVHRETITLDGGGVITTGFLPDDASVKQEGAIRYITSDLSDDA